MASGDIREVEAEIRLVVPPLASHYQSTSRRGFSDAIERLEEIEEEGFGDRESAVAAVLVLLFLLQKQLDRPISKTRRRSFEVSAKRLIIAGIRSTGGAGGRLKARGPMISRHARFAALELQQMSASRLQANKTTQRLDGLLLEFQTSEKARRTVRERKAAEKELQEKAEAKAVPGKKPKAKPEKIPKKKDGKKGAPDREAWKAELFRVIQDRNNAITNVIADAWAYRQFSVGVFLAAKASRIIELIAINPKDKRTTKFCNWVHGKVISVKRVEKQINSYQDAIRSKDKSAAIDAWPFINQSDKALGEARAKLRKGRTGTRQGSGKNKRRAHRAVNDAEVFRGFFAKVGMPPYHFL